MLYHTAQDDLLISHRTHHAMIEFTRDCNMRCVYCAVSQPQWKKYSLDFNQFDFKGLIDELKDRELQVAILHGHGETTIVDRWDEYADLVHNSGVKSTICTNLAKDFSDRELDVLSKFSGITVSIDTIDPIMFKKLRRGGDLRKIINNQIEIQKRSATAGHNIQWTWSSVIADKTISGLVALIEYGLSIGVKTFCVCNLTEQPVQVGIEFKHLARLSQDEIITAIDVLKRAEEICKQNDAVFDIKAGLIDSLELAVV